MYAILDVEANRITANGDVYSKEAAIKAIAIIRTMFPNGKFKIVYLMVEGE